MIGEAKRFDQTLHQGNDPQSRNVVREYLSKNGLVVVDNPNKYGVDLIAENGNFQIEVEHRLPWVDNQFPYSEVNVPERKAKFLREGNCHYIILSRHYTWLGMISGATIKPYMINDNLVENPNKFVSRNELFFKVPMELFKWIKL